MTPKNTAHPEAFSSVVWLLSKNTTAVTTSNAIDKPITTQIIILGKNSKSIIASSPRAVEIPNPINR